MKKHAIIQFLLLVALLYMARVSHAGTLNIEDAAVTDQELSVVRGGFIMNDGLLVSFGIDRAIYVNGVLDTASSFQAGQAGGVGQSQFTASAAGAGAIRLVQIGPAGSNIFNPGKFASSIPDGFTVIQNSMDHQYISNATVINASVANMNLFRDLNLTAALRHQMINAVH
jgi:hypothetical protein